MTEVEKMRAFIQKGYTYNAETGEVFTTRKKVTKVAGKLGYLRMMTSLSTSSKYKTYDLIQTYNHRFAWFYHYGELPKFEIDHINKDKKDNRIENLRDVSHKFNTAIQIGKGYQVYDTQKYGKRYYAQICRNGKTVKLGLFDNPSDATNAYLVEKLRILSTLREDSI